jgi:hypothetical protein
MHDSQWQTLRASLLKGGVPFWRVGRVVTELQDHCRDLEEEAQSAGLTPEEAVDDAATRLGDMSGLANQYLSCVNLTTWWGRLSVVQVCVVGDTVMFQQQAGIALRWCSAAMGAALFTSCLLLVLHLTIFGS